MEIVKRCSTRGGFWHAFLVRLDSPPSSRLFRVRWRRDAAVCCNEQLATAESEPFVERNGRIEAGTATCSCGKEHPVGVWVAPYDAVPIDLEKGQLKQARADGANCWCQAEVPFWSEGNPIRPRDG